MRSLPSPRRSPNRSAAVVREPTAAGAESLGGAAGRRRAVPASGGDEADSRGARRAGQIRRPRAPARSLGGRVARARRADRLAVGEALAVAAGAAQRASTLSTPGSRPSSAARSSSSAGERSAPISSSHTAACVAGGARERLATLVGDHRVGDAGVGRAAAAVGEPLALEAVEETRHAGGREPQALGEIDPPQRPALRVGEVEKRLEVVRAQAVVGEQARLDRPHQRAMGVQELGRRRSVLKLVGSILDETMNSPLR